MRSNVKNLLNKQFGRLTVVEWIGFINKKTYWKCLCECGNTLETASYRLVSGKTKSCGCLWMDKMINHKFNLTHGSSNTLEYGSYCGAKSRCQNSNNTSFIDYGGRGIEFKFNSFEEFYKELGDKPEPKYEYSLDRIDNDGHYEVGNVRWSTRKEQANNRRNNLYKTFAYA